MTAFKKVPVKGTAAPTISRILKAGGAQDFTSTSCRDYVSVRTRQGARVKIILDNGGYVYTYTTSNGSAAFRVNGRRTPTPCVNVNATHGGLSRQG